MHQLDYFVRDTSHQSYFSHFFVSREFGVKGSPIGEAFSQFKGLFLHAKLYA